jgi:hypothetical protein
MRCSPASHLVGGSIAHADAQAGDPACRWADRNADGAAADLQIIVPCRLAP